MTRTCLTVFVVFLLVTGFSGRSLAADSAEKASDQQKSDQSKSKIDISVKDLPNPIPEVLEGIKRVGDEVGKGISKAASAAAEAVNKAVSDKKDKDKKE
ncbi:MAG: hypothetical protein AB1555_16550 [Nitrospirota bacterium]